MTELRKNIPEEFDPKNPWEGDKLDRQSVADFLTPVIASIRQPFVIGLHSPYGTGKTDFLNRWSQSLENEGYKVVRFNAWETDFSSDPLSAFVSALRGQLATDKEKKDGKFRELAQRAGRIALKESAMAVAKGFIEQKIGGKGTEILFDSYGKLTEAGTTFANGLGETALAAQEEAESAMLAFKGILKKSAFEETKDFSDENHKKVLIFIDELDRCRPTYAVHVLETIKHFFSVDGVAFIIAIDDKQLLSSIASVYGPNLDADGYLRRFIDWSYKIPEPKAALFVNHLFDTLELGKLAEEHGELANFAQKNSLQFALENFATVLPLTLRQQEQVLTRINLFVRTASDDKLIFMFGIGLVASLDTWQPQMFRDLLDQEKKLQDFQFTYINRLSLRLTKTYDDDSADLFMFLIKVYLGDGSTISNELNALKRQSQSKEIKDLKRSLLTDMKSLVEKNRFPEQFVGRSPSIAGIILKQLEDVDQFIA